MRRSATVLALTDAANRGARAAWCRATLWQLAAGGSTRRPGYLASRRVVQCLGFSSARSYGASVAIDDKYDGLQRLVQMGKEKGYVLYDEVSEVLPGDLPGGAELEDVLAGLDVAGIEILEEPKDFEKKLEESEELIDIELPAGVGEKINDPVRMYLREMGTVPLLTRDGEVEIARRIERGQNTVLKSLSRAPLAIQEIVAMGEEMNRETISARDLIQISDPLMTDELVEEKRQELSRVTEEI